MARGDTQINFRIPEALKAQLEAAAQANRRSLTAEIVARVQESFEQRPKLSTVPKDMAEQIAEHLLNRITPEEFGAGLKKLTRPLKQKAPPK